MPEPSPDDPMNGHPAPKTGPSNTDWTIEYAEIAPAFGRPGGGYQLLFRDVEGEAMEVIELLRRGVLLREGVAK